MAAMPMKKVDLAKSFVRHGSSKQSLGKTNASPTMIKHTITIIKVAVSSVFQFWALSTIMSFLKGFREIFVKGP